MIKRSLLAFLLLVSSPALAQGQEPTSEVAAEISQALARMSRASQPGGEGAAGFEAVMHPTYRRWVINTPRFESRDPFIQAVGEWLDDGWATISSKSEILEMRSGEGVVLVRRRVQEEHSGPQDQKSSSQVAIAETWVKYEGSWRLFDAVLYPFPDAD